MNVYEMEGFLRGKCVPRDLIVNESNAAYLVRKLSEIASVKAERDALEVRLRNALSSEQESIQRAHAANQTIDALAVENQALSAALSLISGSYGLSPHIQSMCAVDTPTTDAALAVIQAQGVEKLADKLDAEIEQIMRGAFFYDEISSREAISKMVREFATELREAK
ncbi:TPA: hypothetical protein ACKQDX_002136 [Serratia marcescens]